MFTQLCIVQSTLGEMVVFVLSSTRGIDKDGWFCAGGAAARNSNAFLARINKYGAPVVRRRTATRSTVLQYYRKY